MTPFDPVGLSRVELEPLLGVALETGDYAQAEAIRQELAARTWQHTNPYADLGPFTNPALGVYGPV